MYLDLIGTLVLVYLCCCWCTTATYYWFIIALRAEWVLVVALARKLRAPVHNCWYWFTFIGTGAQFAWPSVAPCRMVGSSRADTKTDSWSCCNRFAWSDSQLPVRVKICFAAFKSKFRSHYQLNGYTQPPVVSKVISYFWLRNSNCLKFLYKKLKLVKMHTTDKSTAALGSKQWGI